MGARPKSYLLDPCCVIDPCWLIGERLCAAHNAGWISPSYGYGMAAASSTQVYATLRVLRTHGLQIASIGDRITCDVPESMTADHVISWIRRHRTRILQILSIEDSQVIAPSQLSLQHLYYVRYGVHRVLLSELLRSDLYRPRDLLSSVAV